MNFSVFCNQFQNDIEVHKFKKRYDKNYISSIKRFYRIITGKKLYKYGLIDSWILSKDIKKHSKK